MYLAMRTINGIIATLAGLLASLFLLTFGTSSGTLNTMVLQFGSVGMLFALDLLLRKREQMSDVLFSALWTTIWGYASFKGLRTLSYENVPPELGGQLVFGAMVLVLYVLPPVLNGTYLSRLLLHKGAAT